jgi:hypothetical protein
MTYSCGFRELVQSPKDTKVLEEYWEAHKGEDTESSLPNDSYMDSPTNIRFQPVRGEYGRSVKHTRTRSASDGTGLLPPGQILSPHHPAWSLSNLLSTFGPLVFPIYRAALLRRRILISCHAPVHEICDFGIFIPITYHSLVTANRHRSL